VVPPLEGGTISDTFCESFDRQRQQMLIFRHAMDNWSGDSLLLGLFLAVFREIVANRFALAQAYSELINGSKLGTGIPGGQISSHLTLLRRSQDATVR
jgi:hypothetical protein